MLKEVELSIPANLNIDQLIPTGIKGEARKKFHDRTVYLVHTIKNRLNTKKVFDAYIETGYVRLMKKYLRDLMAGQTEMIIKQLVASNVLVVDPDFQKGFYSMGYILTNDYIIAPTKRTSLISYEVTKQYRNIEAIHRQAQRKLSIKIPKVISQINKDWKIDVEGSQEWIKSFEFQFYSKLDESGTIPASRKEDIRTKYYQYYRYVELLIGNINEGTTEWIIDPKAGRLHTAFTNLPRPLKNFMTYEGTKLATIDIKNSQPFLYAWMTKRQFWSTIQKMHSGNSYDTEFALFRIGKDLHREIMRKQRSVRTAIIKMLETLETIDNTACDDLNFTCLVQHGKLYEYIADQFQGKYIENGIDRFGTRNLTKREVMRIMYFDTKKAKVPFYRPFLQFAELFPVEAQIMRLIKSCGYQKFPVLLQKIESKLMLEKVGEHMPKFVPFLTIHDSLIIPAQDEVIAAANDLIKNQFNAYLTLTPRISEPELLVPENAFEMLESYIEEKMTNLEMRFATAGNDDDDDNYEVGS